jgi:UDP-glucose 4-epimerase
VLDDFSTGRRENLASRDSTIEVVEGDIRNRELVRQLMDGVDVVFHLAAVAAVAPSISDPLTCNEVNVGGTLNVLAAARDAKVRRGVIASSAAVYGPEPPVPTPETSPCVPVSPYAASKVAGEHYSRVFATLYGVETVSLRLFNVYGPRQDPASEYSGVVSRFMERLLQGEAPVVDGDGEQSRDFVFVDDVVQALTLAAEVPGISGEVFNVGTSQRTTINELATTLAAVVAPEKQIAPVHRVARAGDVRHSRANIGKAKRDLGYAPRYSLAEGLARTVAWWRQETGPSGRGR